ncbi:MAG TPA: hypothetical protein VH392_07435, partial [Sphingomicrobium sp.]
LDTLRSRLLALCYARLALHPLRAGLRTLRHAGRTLHALLTRLLALGALGPFGSLERGEMLLTLHARGCPLHLCGRAATAALSALGVLSASATLLRRGLAVLVRPRTRRGCDRQRGDAGCEKNPGHN